MTPANIPLDPYTHGDTWQGIPQMGPMLFDAVNPPHTLTSVRMMFRCAPDDINPVATLTSPLVNGVGISISNTTTWQCTIPAQPLALPVGTWVFDIEFTDSAGLVYTIYAGQQVVTPDIART